MQCCLHAYRILLKIDLSEHFGHILNLVCFKQMLMYRLLIIRVVSENVTVQYFSSLNDPFNGASSLLNAELAPLLQHGYKFAVERNANCAVTCVLFS